MARTGLFRPEAVSGDVVYRALHAVLELYRRLFRHSGRQAAVPAVRGLLRAGNRDGGGACGPVRGSGSGGLFPATVGGNRRRHLSAGMGAAAALAQDRRKRSEEHTSELQSLMRISYAVFCLTKKKQRTNKKKPRSH